MMYKYDHIVSNVNHKNITQIGVKSSSFLY